MLRDSLIVFIQSSLPVREAGVLMGMVLGEKAGFSKEFYTLLKNSGLIHLMVASGSNVMLLGGGVIEGLAGWVGRKWAIGVGMMVVWLYAGLTGFEIPVIRAILMVAIFYWAQLLGRKFNLFRALVLTVIIMAVADVGFLGEVGFWLSFLAFIGVITGEKLLSSRGRRPRRSFGDCFVTSFLAMTGKSVWVSLWVTPVLGLVFGQVSIIGPILNAMVMFLTVVITGVGMVAVLLRLKILLWLLEPVLFYIVKVVEWGGGQSWAVVGIGFNWWMVIGWYAILGWIILRRNPPLIPPLKKGGTLQRNVPPFVKGGVRGGFETNDGK